MLDIKRIRTNFEEVSRKLSNRGVTADVLAELKDLDTKRRELLVTSEESKA